MLLAVAPPSPWRAWACRAELAGSGTAAPGHPCADGPVTGAFLIGQWPVAVVALHSGGRGASGRRHGCRRAHAIRSLLDLAPGGAGCYSLTAAPCARTPPRCRWAPRCALPGRTCRWTAPSCEAASAVVQAPSRARTIADKAPGDALYARNGVNQHGELLMRVTDPASTLLARIVHAVERGQASRAPAALRGYFAAVYAHIVFVLAVLLALLAPPCWAGLGPGPTGRWRCWIACPCALVISTPVTVVSALTAAWRGAAFSSGQRRPGGRRAACAIALDRPAR